MQIKLTREQWLIEIATMICNDIIQPQIDKIYGKGAKQIPPFKFSMSFIRAKKVLAECYVRAVSSESFNEIFVTTRIDDSLQILAAVCHELLHAYDDCESGHQGFFAATARAIGLIGPLRSTVASALLASQLKEFINIYGDIPHARMDIDPKQKGRNNNKLTCSNCDFKANLSSKQCDAIDYGFYVGSTPPCPACGDSSLVVNRA